MSVMVRSTGVARCFSFTSGFANDLHYAVGDFVGKAIAGRDIIINGDGSPLGPLRIWEMLCIG